MDHVRTKPEAGSAPPGREVAAPACTLQQVITVLEEMFPPQSAQSWDRVGLVAGDPAQPVHRILLAIDPTLNVIAEATEAGDDLIITHHPLLLRGIHSVATTTAKGAAVTELISNDIALYCAHTNADVAPRGVGQALAAACGVGKSEPLLITEDQELGRVGDLAEPIALSALAQRLLEALPATPAGIRVSGPSEALVQRVAVLGGAGDNAFDDVAGCGADVYITADLRHHPALEAREEARAGGGRETPYLIDAGHYASEWLWLPVLAHDLAERLPAGVSVRVSGVCTDPWDFVLGPQSPTPGGMP